MRPITITNEMRGIGVAEDTAIHEVEAYQTFAQAVASVAANVPIQLEIERVEDVAANVTVPANIKLRFTRRGRLRIAHDVTVTIASPENIIANPRDYIFECLTLLAHADGAVAFAQVGQVYPGWWGAAADGSTDDLIPIQRSFDSLCDVHLPDGVYVISATLEWIGTCRNLTGESRQTIIAPDDDFTALQLGTASGVSTCGKVAELTFYQEDMVDENSTSCGIYIYDATRTILENIKVEHFGRGIQMYGSSARGNWINTILNPLLVYNQIGIYGLGNANNVIGGEIQGGKIGIAQCILDANNDLDLSDLTSVIGQNILIEGVTIEGQSNEGGTAYGIAAKHSQGFPQIIGCYFEQIGDGDPLSNGVAILVNYANTSNYVTLGGQISSFFTNCPTCIEINGVDGMEIAGCYCAAAPTGAIFIDATNHTASSSYLRIGQNYVSGGYTYIVDPVHRLYRRQEVNPALLQNQKTTDYTVQETDNGALFYGGNGNAVIFTLPGDQGNLEFTFFKRFSAGSVTVTPAAGDAFIGMPAATGLVLNEGDYIRVRRCTSGFWHVMEGRCGRYAHGEYEFGYPATTCGAIVLNHGAGGNTPGYAKILSPNGTAWYLFCEDDGTVKIHNAIPTQNADGTVVGTQT